MNYAALEKISLVQTYPFRGLTFVKGEGVFLFDEAGEQYLDLGSNYGVNILGYNHPTFLKYVQPQLKRLVNLHGSFANDIRAKAAFGLKKLAKKKLDLDYRILFASSGAEIVDNAVKIALFLTGSRKILSFSTAYHGKTLLPLFLTASEKYKQGIPNPFKDLIVRAEFNDLADLEEKFSKEIGVVILELVQGEGGIRPIEKEFLTEIVRLCKKHKALLIVDEIQTGLGRTGRFFCSEIFGLQPDILLLGKGLGGGIPLSAALIRNELAQKLYRGIQTSTFGGLPLAMAGLLAVLEVVNDDFLSQLRETADHISKALKQINSSEVKEVRGLGLMLGIEVSKEKRDLILKKLQKNKVIALPAGENVVRFLPPLVISSEEFSQYYEHIKSCF